MTDHQMGRPRNHGRQTFGKPHNSTNPRPLLPQVPQVSGNVYMTLDNDAEGLSGYVIDYDRRHGSSSDTRTFSAQVGVNIAGDQITAASIDLLTQVENESPAPYSSSNTHSVSSASIPTSTHEKGDANSAAYKTTFDLYDSHPLGKSPYHHSNPDVPFLYPTSNTNATTSNSDVWRRSYQTNPSLTSTYMNQTSISSNANPYSQSKFLIQSENPVLSRYGTPMTYSPPALDIPNSHGDTTWTDGISSQLQGTYTHYEGTQPGFDDSGDPPSARQWSTESNQGSTAGDSTSQATQEDDEARWYEDRKGLDDNELQRDAIRGYMNREGPWAYEYNMGSR